MSDNSSIDIFLCRLEEPDLDLYVLKIDNHQWAFDCDISLLATYFKSLEILQFTDCLSISKTSCIGQLMSNNVDSTHLSPVLDMDVIVAFCDKCFDASVLGMFFQICELNLPNFRAYNLSSDDFKSGRQGSEVIQTSAAVIWPLLILAEIFECKIMSVMLINRLHSLLCSNNCEAPNTKLPRQLLDGIPSYIASFHNIIDTFRTHFHNFPVARVEDKTIDGGNSSNCSTAEDSSNSSCDLSLDENVDSYRFSKELPEPTNNKFNIDCSTSMESCESIYVDIDNASQATFGSDLRLDGLVGSKEWGPRRVPTPEPYPVHVRYLGAAAATVNATKIESRGKSSSLNNEVVFDMRAARGDLARDSQAQFSLDLKNNNSINNNNKNNKENIAASDRAANISRKSSKASPTRGGVVNNPDKTSYQRSPSLAQRKEHSYKSSNNNNNDNNNDNNIRIINNDSIDEDVAENDEYNRNNNRSSSRSSKISPIRRNQRPVPHHISTDNDSDNDNRMNLRSPSNRKSISPQQFKVRIQSPSTPVQFVEDVELQNKIALEKELRAQEARRRATERIRQNKKLAEDKLLKEKQESSSKIEKKWAMRDQKISNFVERQQKSLVSHSDMFSPKQQQQQVNYNNKSNNNNNNNNGGISSDAASPQTIISEPWNVFNGRTSSSNAFVTSSGQGSKDGSKIEKQSTPDFPLKRTSITPIKKFTPKELQAVGLTPQDVAIDLHSNSNSVNISVNNSAARETSGPVLGSGSIRQSSSTGQTLSRPFVSKSDSVLRDARDFKSLLDNSLNESFDSSMDRSSDIDSDSRLLPNPSMKLFRSPDANKHSHGSSGTSSSSATARRVKNVINNNNKNNNSGGDGVDMVTVTVLRAWGLQDTLTGTNPYVVVDWGVLGRAATQAVSSTTNPTFSSFLKFKSPFKPVVGSTRKTAADNIISFNGKMYYMPKSDNMRICVYSRNKVVSDELIGESSVESNQLLGYFISAPSDGSDTWDESTHVTLTVPLAGLDRGSAGGLELQVALDSEHSAFF